MMGHKKKLEKWLGDDVQEAFEPHPRPPAEENPAYLAVDYSEDDIIVNSDNSIKAGTLPALIERLTLHDKLGEPVKRRRGGIDSDFSHLFQTILSTPPS